MDHPEIIPRRVPCTSNYKCIHCGHWWEAEGWAEGNGFDTNELCPSCGEEQY